MPKFRSLLKRKKVLIGALHFPPLLGYPKHPGLAACLKNALADLKSLEQGGADAVIFENNYDLPHKPVVDPPVIASMVFLGEKLRQATRLPLGISVLWNDYLTALSIAKILGLQFIRVPVFVDTVKASCGIIAGDPNQITSFRKRIGAEDVSLLTDIHVKHSRLLSRMSLVESARAAVKNGSDALIVTGHWTGEGPDLSDLASVRQAVGAFPVLAGSGVDEANASKIFKLVNGAIVSTSLKAGGMRQGEINVKAWTQRISQMKVRRLVNIVLR